MATKPYHHGNLRRALIESGLKLLAENGIRNLTLRNVAKDAGVAPSALYRHYESKDALLAGIAEDGFAKLIQTGEKEIKRHGDDPPALYDAMSRVYLSFALENPEQLRLMFSSAIDDRSRYPELQATASRSFQQLVDAVQACQERGLIKKNQDTMMVTMALWSMYHGLSLLAVEGQLAGVTSPKKARALGQALGKMVLDGLRE